MSRPFMTMQTITQATELSKIKKSVYQDIEAQRTLYFPLDDDDPPLKVILGAKNIKKLQSRNKSKLFSMRSNGSLHHGTVGCSWSCFRSFLH